MQICLLTYQDLDAPEPPDGDWLCDPRPHLPEADWTLVCLEKADCVTTVERLVADGHELFFNLCDAAEEEDDPGIDVVRTLERLGVAFTGADSSFFDPSREAMKEACAQEGIDTPAFRVARNERDVERAARALRFPLFVKHHRSYSSINLSRASRVATPAGLRRQARKIIDRHGAALIEEYVAGTECTVLVAEDPARPAHPTTYQPIQVVFPPGEEFKHSDLKWVDFEGMDAVPVVDPTLDGVLRDISARFFSAIGGVGFGRCDLRIDESGRPFMLEINPNCGIYYPSSAYACADLCLLHDPAGHEGFTRQLVEAALSRHAASRSSPASRAARRSEAGARRASR